MASQVESRFALCLLPHSPWSIPCEILRKFEGIDATTKIQRSKLEILIRNLQPLSLLLFNRSYPSIQRLIVPANSVLHYLHYDKNFTGSAQAGDPTTHKFRNKTYLPRYVSKLKLREEVVWAPRDSIRIALMFGKIDFIGELDSTEGKNGLVFAFVCFPNGINYFFGSHEKETHENLCSVVYRIPIDELILFADYASFTKSVSCTGSLTEDGNTVEIIYNINEPLPMTTDSSYGVNGESTASHALNDLENNKIGRVPNKIDDNSRKGSHKNADLNPTSMDKPYSKSDARNEADNFPTKLSSNGSGQVPSSSSTSGCQIFSTSFNAVQFFGNCYAKENGFKPIKAERIKVGDSVVAFMTEMDIVAGVVKLICTINNFASRSFIGCQFERPLTSARFSIEHCFSSSCTTNCTDGILAFIPMELFFGDDPVVKALPSKESLNSSGKLQKPNEPHFQNLDYTVEARRTGVWADTPIEYFDVSRPGSKFKLEGICGRLNSCYADVSLFSMFAFTNSFDTCLSSPAIENMSESKALINMAICKILQYDIVSPLRAKGKVGADAMTKLRSALSTYDQQFMASFMDAEEFMLVLLESVMSITPYYTFNNGGTDYIFQIFVTLQNKGDKGIRANLQKLLEISFSESDVKLLAIPEPAFIVKLPVCDGKPLFEMVLPNLIIDLKGLLDSPENLPVTCTKMLLRAVICLKNNHYTCFARASPGKYSYWAHYDSRPVQQSPVVYWIANLSEMLEDPKYPRSKYTSEACDTLDYLLRHAYMCIYEPIIENKETCL